MKRMETYDDNDPDLGGAQFGYDGQGIRVARWLVDERNLRHYKWAKVQTTSAREVTGFDFLEQHDGDRNTFALLHMQDGSARLLIDTHAQEGD